MQKQIYSFAGNLIIIHPHRNPRFRENETASRPESLIQRKPKYLNDGLWKENAKHPLPENAPE